MADEQTQRDEDGGGVATAAETLSVTDNRTGESYEVEIEDGTVKAMDFRQIKVSEDDFGLMTYDPAFTNTASVRSAVCYIDGEAGVLEYRGYPIDELCERSSYLEVAYLLIYGELPTQEQLDEWVFEITHHTFVHENIKKFVEGFRYDAHPMGMLLATVGALSTFYPDAKKIDDDLERQMTEAQYAPDPRLERALDVLWILHADHEQNCSTNAVRGVGSSEVDPYSAVAAGVAALYGPLHGGANEAVLKMLDRIETTENIPDFLERVKNKDEKLMGFGHRVYKNYDPRAEIIKKHVDEVFEVTGKNPKLDIAVELEKRAVDDDYFSERKLYPNVDFYSGLIYEALNLPPDMFTVMFAIPRTSGWVAQWLEMVQDPETKIARPRQIYTGAREQSYVPIEKREKRSEKPVAPTNLIDPARNRK